MACNPGIARQSKNSYFVLRNPRIAQIRGMRGTYMPRVRCMRRVKRLECTHASTNQNTTDVLLQAVPPSPSSDSTVLFTTAI